MTAAADLEQAAAAAFAEAARFVARSPERRAAGHLWIALTIPLTIPPAKTLAGARAAIASFGTPDSQAAALELLDKITTTTERTAP